MHRFFHADRARSLVEDQELNLDSKGLSRFGATYWHEITTKSPDQMTEAELREFHLENIRREPQFANYASRVQSLFAANSIEEAIWFARSIKPRPEYEIPIFEVFSSTFWTLDMNWMDYACDPDQSLRYYREYWYGAITNHNPPVGERRPPRLEVLIRLPAKVGKIVAYA